MTKTKQIKYPCELCETLDPAEYKASVKTIFPYKDCYLCRACCRDLEKLCLATNIRDLRDE